MPALAPIGTFLAQTAFSVGALNVSVGTVAMVTLSAGSMVYSQMQAKEMEKKARAAMLQNQGMTLTSRDPAAMRRVIYGRARAGGTIVFITGPTGASVSEHLSCLRPSWITLRAFHCWRASLYKLPRLRCMRLHTW